MPCMYAVLWLVRTDVSAFFDMRGMGKWVIIIYAVWLNVHACMHIVSDAKDRVQLNLRQYNQVLALYRIRPRLTRHPY